MLHLPHAGGFRPNVQNQPEWVMLVRGTALLRFDPGGDIPLKTGDFLTIPAHSRHRVESVSSDAVWLALYLATGRPED